MCLKVTKVEKANDEELKQEAVKRLEILELDQQIIQEFINNDTVYITHFMNNKVFATPMCSKFIEILKQFEHENNTRIYHIINIENKSKIRLCLLCVRDNKLEWSDDRKDLKHGFVQIFSYDIDRDIKYIGIETNSGKVERIV